MKLKYAIQKWNSRKEATKLARLRVARLKAKLEQAKKKQVFGAFNKMFKNSKNFMNRMSNLANIHDH